MIVGCTGNYRKPDYLDIINHINIFFSKNNIKCLVSSDLYNSEDISDSNIDSKLDIVEFSELEKKADVMLCIGGDGTFLSTARRMCNHNLPLLGIHIGGLGFLADISKEDLDKSLQLLINKEYVVESRMRIDLSLKQNGKIEHFNALNDIVVDHGESGRILRTKVNVGNSYLNTYESDGMIVSTSIGSTAYSLSSGGPIIHPKLDIIIITPICSHSLSARSIVLSGDELVSIEFPDFYKGICCTVDGQQRFLIEDSSKLEIKRSTKDVKVITLPTYNYFDTLRNKMRWSGNLR